jgi:transcriptional regulator with XRE-family HTH domain
MKKSSAHHISLSKNLPELLKKRGMTIRELSLKANVPAKTLYGWTWGNQPRDLYDVLMVAKCLDVTIEDLAFEFSETNDVSEDIQSDISKWLLVLRQRMRFSPREVADCLNISPDQLQYYESTGNVPVSLFLGLMKIYQQDDDVVLAKITHLLRKVAV